MNAKDTRDPETYELIGACMEVHSELGHGFLEPVYQKALAAELARREIPFKREQEFEVLYKGERIGAKYKADFVCFDSVILELKALSAFSSAHEGQLINYLKVTGIQRGLLINFGTPKLQYKRLILSR
jgi:GxxExxY protein